MSFIVTQHLTYLFSATIQSVRWNTSNLVCLQSYLGCLSYFFSGSCPSQNGLSALSPLANFTVYPLVLIASEIDSILSVTNVSSGESVPINANELLACYNTTFNNPLNPDSIYLGTEVLIQTAS